MHQRRAGHPFLRGGFLLLGVVVLGGCQSMSSVKSMLTRSAPAATQSAKAPAAAKTVLTPNMELSWQVSSPENRPDLVSHGKGIVGPDGALVVGPYGPCAVAGLTPDQASRKLERHLSSYVKNPSVKLGVANLPEITEVAWRTARSSPPGGSKGAAGHFVSTAVVGKDKNDLPMIPTVPMKEAAEPPPILPLPQPLTLDGGSVPPSLVVQGPVGPIGPGVPSIPGFPLARPLAPSECRRELLPPYVVGPPDVLQIELLPTKGLQQQPVRGPHLIRPDGTIGLGIYGSILVAGQTLDEVKDTIAKVVLSRLDPEILAEKAKKKIDVYKEISDYLSVDVAAYNSKVYYVITDGGGLGEQVYPFPITGYETVLDAIGKINGLPPVSSKKHIWVARRTPGLGAMPKILPVDWIGVTQRGETATNFQIMPGDRVYVQADAVRRFDNNLAKWLSPIERLFGGALLGSQTVNSIRNGTNGFNNSGIGGR